MGVNFDPLYIFELLPRIIRYIPITLLMAVLAMILAIAVGLMIALARNSKNRLLSAGAAVYISFFRAIPISSIAAPASPK